MGTSLRRAGVAVVLLASLVACRNPPGLPSGGKPKGTFTVHFTGKRPDCLVQTGLFIFGRVERRAPGQVVEPRVSVGPYACGAVTSLDFNPVKDDDHLVVVVEYREGNTTAARVAAYGVSTPFTLQAGTHVDVEVAFQLGPSPVLTTSVPPLRVEPTGVEPYINSKDVTLEVATASRGSVRLSNCLTMPAEATEEVGLATLETLDASVPEGVQVYAVRHWNVEGVRRDGGVVPVSCVKTMNEERWVFAQVMDDAGYGSPVAAAMGRLDQDPPALPEQDSLRVLPAAVRARQGFTVRLVFKEDLVQFPSGALRVEGAAGFTFTCSGIPDGGSSNTVTCSSDFTVEGDRSVPDSFLDAGVYPIRAGVRPDGGRVLDRAGNALAPLTVGSIAVDRRGPELVERPLVHVCADRRCAGGGVPCLQRCLDGGACVSTCLSKEGGFLHFGFAPSEDLDLWPRVWLGDRWAPADSCVDGGPRAFWCDVDTGADPGAEGVQPINLELWDGVGNMRSHALGTVMLDFSPPAILDEDVSVGVCDGLSPATATTDSRIRVVVRADEDTAGPVLLEALPQFGDGGSATEIAYEPMPCAEQDGGRDLRLRRFCFKHTVTAGEPRGEHRLRVTWSDRWGHSDRVRLQTTLAVVD